MKAKTLLTTILMSGLLVACGGDKKTPENTEPNEPVEETQIDESQDYSDVVDENMDDEMGTDTKEMKDDIDAVETIEESPEKADKTDDKN